MTRTSARPPTGTGALTAKPSLFPAVTLPKRDARHLAPPKTMNMAVRHAPSPTPLSGHLVIARTRLGKNENDSGVNFFATTETAAKRPVPAPFFFDD